MSRYEGIHHLALATGDIDRTIRFWRDLLGMRMVVSHGGPGYRHYFFEISGKDMIAFFEWPDVEPLPERDHGARQSGPVAFDHVAIGVVDRADLWRIKDDLEAAGFWVSEAVDHGFVHSIYTFDPNNVPVEFSWSPPGRDVRKDPPLADREPTEVAREGPEPRREAWPAVEHPTPPEERRVYPGIGSDLARDAPPGLPDEGP